MATAGSAGSDDRSGAPSRDEGVQGLPRLAGEFCTITSSNISGDQARDRGSSTPRRPNFALGFLDSDLVIDGPGNNTAFGHVVLDLSTFTGVVTFSGGTGRFSHFHAGPLAVACPEFPACSWDGAYDFTPPDDK